MPEGENSNSRHARQASGSGSSINKNPLHGRPGQVSLPEGWLKDDYMQFAQLTPGVVVNSSPRIVTAAEIVEFASRYDPQWMHVDAARAKKGRWKGLIASGWLTCSIAMELTVKTVLAQSTAFGSPGVDGIKWVEPLRPDDAVMLRFEVLRQSKSPSGRTGILLSKTELWNQKDKAVLSMQLTTLFEI
jgi:acyl dehydratase